MVDTSGSEGRMLGVEQDAVGQFIGTVLRDKDLAFLMSFDVNVDLLQDLTATTQDLRTALRKTEINTGGGGGLPGLGGGPIPQAHPKGTLLYDAVYLASQEKLRHEVGRKALIIFTDGNDEGSQTSLGQAIEAAQKADTIVYVLLVYDPRFIRGDREMRRLCEETGGRVIEVGESPKKLKTALEELSNELRSQYYIGYTPANRTPDGAFRKVEIHTKIAGLSGAGAQGLLRAEAVNPVTAGRVREATRGGAELTVSARSIRAGSECANPFRPDSIAMVWKRPSATNSAGL